MRKRKRPSKYYKIRSSGTGNQRISISRATLYLFNQRSSLNAFLLDGHIAIHNNIAENAIRPFVVGRKNWLFADTTRGAEASALFYSIILTAKINNLNPYNYLIYLFSNLPSIITKGDIERLHEFFPWSDSLPGSCSVSPIK